jgi:hypothetical protein
MGNEIDGQTLAFICGRKHLAHWLRKSSSAMDYVRQDRRA